MAIKKKLLFLEIDEKWLLIQGVKHLAHFWQFLKAQAEKLIPHSQISFKSWLNNVAELGFFFKKSMLCWLEEVGFQTAGASPKP